MAPAKLGHVMDDPVRFEVGYGNFGVAERDADHGDTGAPGDADIGTCIAHHDGGLKFAAGAGNGLAQDSGIRLGNPEGVGAANSGKTAGSNSAGRAGAWTAIPACWCKPRSGSRDCRDHPARPRARRRGGKRPRYARHNGDEVVGQAVELGQADVAAIQFQPAFEQLPRAGADHVAGGVQRHRWHAFPREDEIKRVDQVGCGIDQGAIEVEDDDAGRRSCQDG